MEESPKLQEVYASNVVLGKYMGCVTHKVKLGIKQIVRKIPS